MVSTGEDFLRVSIKREKSSNGTPDGAASNYFHEILKIGSEIEVLQDDFYLPIQ